MLFDEPLQYLRWVNSSLFLIVLVWFSVRINDTWHRHDAPMRRFSIALVLLFAAGSYGSAESFILHAGTGPRIPLITLALLGLVHGLWSSRHDAKA